MIAWTFDDAKFDTKRFHSSAEEVQSVCKNGVDGIFTDFPASEVQARKAAGRIAECLKAQSEGKWDGSAGDCLAPSV